MASRIGVLVAPNLEDAVRAVLLLNNSVAIVFSFIGLEPALIALGTIFGISILFNLGSILANPISSRLRLEENKPVSPYLPALALEFVGTVTFLILYILAVVVVLDGEYWQTDLTFIHAYATVGALVAFVLHSFLTILKTRQYLHYRRSFTERCPHCHHKIEGGFENEAPTSSNEVATPGPHARRDSFSANSVGEAESDSLIMKP